ncbi:MAG TPA: hypothetical protein VEO95_11565 [Chthoniobacteraceae bacterium]|nr:hypothetical protein [Chthoniobacteraceae bacterium]
MTFSRARLFAPLQRFFRDPAFRQLLRFCAPALLVGLALRVALTASMPYAYIQYDSADFFSTVSQWFEQHRVHIHFKRSFLTPVLFLLPFALHLRPFLLIPAAQHLMGLWGTLIVGSLVRSWFRWWKIAIFPVTIIFAASPWVIWYEHTIMGEAQYLFFTLLMVWAGTRLAQRRTGGAFAFFLVSLVLVMGTRLEAKLYFAFAFMLVAFVFWKRWRLLVPCVAVLVLAAVITFLMGGKREGSGLAYATLIKLTPDHLKSEPAVEPYVMPIRDEVRRDFPDYPADLIKIDKTVQATIETYVASWQRDIKKWDDEKAKILRNLCLEAVKAHPVEALILPLTKFALATDAWSAYAFDTESLGVGQQHAVTLKPWVPAVVGRGTTGRVMSDDEARMWVADHYNPRRVAWFENYEKAWNQARIALRLPDRHMSQSRWIHDYYGGVPHPYSTFPGMPIYFIAAFAGMLAAIARPHRLGMLHLAWVLTMLGDLYVVSMVAVTNARFRFAYEPFALIYFFLLFDCVAEWIAARRAGRSRVVSEPAAA